MQTTLDITLNGQPLDKVVAEEKRNRTRELKGDKVARKIVTDKLHSFYRQRINKSRFTKVHETINTSFELSDLGEDNRYDTEAQFLTAVRNNPTLASNIVEIVRRRMEAIFSSGNIEKQKVYKQLKIELSNISIKDIDVILIPTNTGTKLQVKLRPVSRARIIKKIFTYYRKDHEIIVKAALQDLQNYLTRLEGKTTVDTIRKMQQVAKEFTLANAVIFVVSVGNVREGKNIFTLENLPNYNEIVSAAQWTLLTRKRLEDTTEDWDKKQRPAKPPFFKKRSGKFIGSVTVKPRYKKGKFDISYIEYYSRNKLYKYEPDRQIAEAVEYVAEHQLQDEIAREFGFETVFGE